MVSKWWNVKSDRISFLSVPLQCVEPACRQFTETILKFQGIVISGTVSAPLPHPPKPPITVLASPSGTVSHSTYSTGVQWFSLDKGGQSASERNSETDARDFHWHDRVQRNFHRHTKPRDIQARVKRGHGGLKSQPLSPITIKNLSFIGQTYKSFYYYRIFMTTPGGFVSTLLHLHDLKLEPGFLVKYEK